MENRMKIEGSIMKVGWKLKEEVQRHELCYCINKGCNSYRKGPSMTQIG